MNHYTQELDTRGLNCPLPILKAKKAINALSDKQTLKVIATDPGSVKDFESFCQQTGNTLISSEDNGSEFTFLIEKNN